MAGEKFIKHNGSGGFTETEATQTGGAGAANKIAALDANGRFVASMMPTGVAADTAVLDASEALSAGNAVNVWNDGGTPKVRKADATTTGKPAHGFVKAAFSTGESATVYFEGNNGDVTGLTAGDVFLSTTAGLITNTAPTGSGNVVQKVGFATSATNMNFDASTPVVLA